MRKHTLTSWMAGCASLLPLLLLAPAAQAQTQASLSGLDAGMTGPRAQVLVLGTVHLSALTDGFDRASLQGVLDRLAAFKPDIITIEAVSGEECDLAARHPQKYSVEYCPSTVVARKSTGLEVPAAMAEVARMLKAWPSQPSPAQRRQLAAFMLAANDRASAYAQWLQLPESERKPGDGLDAALVDLLGQISNRRNENYLLGSRLAARLGLPRVYATDNHTGDDVKLPDEEAFGRAVSAAWKAGRGELAVLEQRVQALSAQPDLLPLYRYINDPVYLHVSAQANVNAQMRARSPERYPQVWVAGWETRNLRMVANIREAFRELPGARVLSIVGSGHKPWFDSWLGQMQGVDIVDAGQVLK